MHHGHAALIKPRELNTKIHAVVNANGIPVKFTVTCRTVVDCSQACKLIDGIKAECIIADRGYDTDKIITEAVRAGEKINKKLNVNMIKSFMRLVI